jgi:hypothetical protein
MKSKILKVISPLGKRQYVALVERKFLFFIPIWVSVRLYDNINEIGYVWHRTFKYKMDSIETAKESIKAYIDIIGKKDSVTEVKN